MTLAAAGDRPTDPASRSQFSSARIWQGLRGVARRSAVWLLLIGSTRLLDLRPLDRLLAHWEAINHWAPPWARLIAGLLTASFMLAVETGLVLAISLAPAPGGLAVLIRRTLARMPILALLQGLLFTPFLLLLWSVSSLLVLSAGGAGPEWLQYTAVGIAGLLVQGLSPFAVFASCAVITETGSMWRSCLAGVSRVPRVWWNLQLAMFAVFLMAWVVHFLFGLAVPQILNPDVYWITERALWSVVSVLETMLCAQFYLEARRLADAPEG